MGARFEGGVYGRVFSVLGEGGEGWDGGFSMAELDGLHELAVGLQALKKQAQALGMFTDDRELLECPACGLKENVTFDGVLFTCMNTALDVDTGLRFPEPDEDGVSSCPECGGVVKGEWL